MYFPQMMGRVTHNKLFVKHHMLSAQEISGVSVSHATWTEFPTESYREPLELGNGVFELVGERWWLINGQKTEWVAWPN